MNRIKKLAAGVVIGTVVSLGTLAPAQAAPPKVKAVCTNYMAYHSEWPWCWNLGWGVPSNCWYIKTVCR
jgi:hypothetical protein